MNWINVKDKLPEVDNEFLLYTFGSSWQEKSKAGFIDLGRYRGGKWVDRYCTELWVTHWCELPVVPDN